MKRRCDNCKVSPDKCRALQNSGNSKSFAELRELQCADDFQPADISKRIFD
jgi:hypothetical protein